MRRLLFGILVVLFCVVLNADCSSKHRGPKVGLDGPGGNLRDPGDSLRDRCRENPKLCQQQHRKTRPLVRPNFVFLLTDDQDLTLGGDDGMPYTLSMMRRHGAMVGNFFVNTPICCPSRATLFSGRYAHHWYTSSNFSCMRMDLSNLNFWNTNVGVLMQDLGYVTGVFGKTLNVELGTVLCNQTLMNDAGYSSRAFHGFNSSMVLCTELTYYNNTWNVNGTLNTTGDEPEDYMTSVIGNKSVEFIENSLKARRPFFAYIGPHAPHYPATPAPWYEGRFEDHSAPITPHYNYTSPKHHYIIRTQPYLNSDDEVDIDLLYQDRLRTLLSVDDIVRSIVSLLEDYEQLSNTYIVWSSDNGYQLGQFCMPLGKAEPYDNDLRVPFFIRGPRIPGGVTFPFMASMVDVLPTLLELAGKDMGPSMEVLDGYSFAPQLRFFHGRGRQLHLIEHWALDDIIASGDHLLSIPNNTFFGIRLLNETHNFMYAEFHLSGDEFDTKEAYEDPFEFELFDLSADPYQKHNVYGLPRYSKLVNELQIFLHHQLQCGGQGDCI